MFETVSWENFLLKERALWQRYGLALVLSLLSLGIAFIFQYYEDLHFTSFALMTVAISAIYGGRGPALVDSVISSVGIDYFFTSPHLQIFDSPSSFLRIFIYILTGYLISSLMHSLRLAYKRLHIEKMARENVLGIVSHDLRSPLSAILMNASVLKKKLDQQNFDSEAHKADRIISSSRKMNVIIQDILDAIKIESGNFTIHARESDLTPVLYDAVEGSQQTASSKNVAIKMQVPEAGVITNCDPDRIGQVVSNLVGNAVKFSPENSEVIVSAEVLSNSVIVRVEDHGPGISPEDQENLFNRYWQAGRTAHAGTGLGLYISKCILDGHKGKINVDSVVGQGSKFELILPRSFA